MNRPRLSRELRVWVAVRCLVGRGAEWCASEPPVPASGGTAALRGPHQRLLPTNLEMADVVFDVMLDAGVAHFATSDLAG